MAKLDTLLERLCTASVIAADRRDAISLPKIIPTDQWFMSPELISIYGTPIWEQLDLQGQKTLSLYEAVNFFSLNIHGEKALVEGISRRLYTKGNEELTPYLHHFLDEENKHMMYFGRFCLQFGGKVYKNRKVSLPRDYEIGEEDFLFFAKVVLFEEIVDVYNLHMAGDSRLNETARALNKMHHDDEVRHLAFGRQIVLELFNRYSKQWSTSALHLVQNHLRSYISNLWREFYNPSVYRDLGLDNPHEVADIAWDSASASLHRQRSSKKLIRFLLDNAMVTEEPAL